MGDDILAGTLLVSACVIEGRLDAEPSVTTPTGWTLVSDTPTGLDSPATRQVLYVATQSIDADGTVPAATWAATGPTDVEVRSRDIRGRPIPRRRLGG